MGKLIVLEAGDGSGKETQTNLLYERLQKDGVSCKKITFPNYQSDSSAPVKMYLSGQLGKHIEDISAYEASVLFAVDRFASYRAIWKNFYDTHDIILADRYVTSNFIHQGIKLSKDERKKFIAWLENFEYEILHLPRPDKVIFLDMPSEISDQLLKNRFGEKDLHEQNKNYLHACHKLYQEIATEFSWEKISCVDQHQKLRSPEEISQDVYKVVQTLLKK